MFQVFNHEPTSTRKSWVLYFRLIYSVKIHLESFVIKRIKTVYYVGNVEKDAINSMPKSTLYKDKLN